MLPARNPTWSSRVVSVTEREGGREVLPLLVLLILALLWAVVLLPPLLRARTERAGDSIGDFNYRLGVLGRTNGTLQATSSLSQGPVVNPYAPRPRVSAAKRRRDVLSGLVLTSALTFLAAYVTGAPALWAVHVLADVLLVAFLALWAWVRSLQQEQAHKVRYLHPSRGPELALRRTAST